MAVFMTTRDRIHEVGLFCAVALGTISTANAQIDLESRQLLHIGIRWGHRSGDARLGLAAGADVPVAGSSIFGDPPGVDTAMMQLRTAAQEIGE